MFRNVSPCDSKIYQDIKENREDRAQRRQALRILGSKMRSGMPGNSGDSKDIAGELEMEKVKEMDEINKKSVDDEIEFEVEIIKAHNMGFE